MEKNSKSRLRFKRENFTVPSQRQMYKCEDCGCIFEARLLRGKQNKTTTPHLEAWMGVVNNCCHCGATMVSEWSGLTQKETIILDSMLTNRRERGDESKTQIRP